MKKAHLLFAAVFMLVCEATSFAASFQGLGDLPGSTFYSAASGVSADGSVVVGTSHSGSGPEAFRWTSSGGMVGLGVGGSSARGVSGDGLAVVGESLAGPSIGKEWEAFRWTSSESMIGLGGLGSGQPISDAFAASYDGSVVVGDTLLAGGWEAFRWTSNGGMVGLGDLPGGAFESHANSVSADGLVVVGWSSSASGAQAFRWTSGGGMVGLGDLLGDGSAHSISADGSIIVGAATSASGIEAFRWTSNGGMVWLGDLGGGSFYSNASDVSDNGSVVVGDSRSSVGTEAFYWTASGGMRNLKDMLTNEYRLDLTGWILTYATGVSADGLTIVGNGINPQGNQEAWAATIPEPATVMLLGLGGMILRSQKAKKLKVQN